VELSLGKRRIVVCVAGGIAAYKACELVRLLVKRGADVSVAMTRSAVKFVGPLTFQALSNRPVFTDLLDLTQDSEMGHIQLADTADVIVVAPATADLLARLAAGQADDCVTALCLATRAPVLLCPAMNVNMWTHPLTRANLARLNSVAGYETFGPDAGELACGWEGAGRLAEPESIVAEVERLLGPKDLRARKLVISAGPTHEPLDPVRFLGNRSSGKMGYALAREAFRRGAEVTLVSGPVALDPPPGIEVIPTRTARDMYREVMRAAKDADAVIMAAAVADVRPATVADDKLKKGEANLATVELEENPDILRELGQRRNGARRPILIGFAAETTRLLDAAKKKLREKHCDAVVANDVSQPESGFDSENNQGALVTPDGVDEWALMSKDAMADRILDWLSAKLGAPDHGRPSSTD
jgi:phosphopantothenoylcysteine decarboxylase/phosphopantothenate--cysteine ligase